MSNCLRHKEGTGFLQEESEFSLGLWYGIIDLCGVKENERVTRPFLWARSNGIVSRLSLWSLACLARRSWAHNDNQQRTSNLRLPIEMKRSRPRLRVSVGEEKKVPWKNRSRKGFREEEEIGIVLFVFSIYLCWRIFDRMRRKYFRWKEVPIASPFEAMDFLNENAEKRKIPSCLQKTSECAEAHKNY